MDVIAPIVLSIAGLAVTFVFAQLTRFIGEKVKDKKASSALMKLLYAVEAAVKAVAQTVVDELKEASKDGKLTKEEQDKVKDMAIQQVKKTLGENVLTELKAHFGDITQLIGDLIEKYIFDSKKKTNA
jgi:type II secretory pathway pseudopilin PulG